MKIGSLGGDCVKGGCYGMSWASQVALVVKIHLPMQEIQVRSLNWEDPLDYGMATHSRVHTCKFPWKEEPNGL